MDKCESNGIKQDRKRHKLVEKYGEEIVRCPHCRCIGGDNLVIFVHIVLHTKQTTWSSLPIPSCTQNRKSGHICPYLPAHKTDNLVISVHTVLHTKQTIWSSLSIPSCTQNRQSGHLCPYRPAHKTNNLVIFVHKVQQKKRQSGHLCP